MIICHKHKFVFVKTAKTAGTSVELFLTKLCDHNDVVTPVKEEDEQIRERLGYGRARNHVTAAGKFWNHMSYFEARDLMLAERGVDINDYYSFTIERHPGEKAVSLYYWAYKGKNNSPYDDENFFINRAGLLKERGWDLYARGGTIAVDHVILYEDLQSGLQEVLRSVGVETGISLPNAKSGVRQDRRSYKELLSPRVIEHIRNLFGDELRTFGYVM